MKRVAVTGMGIVSPCGNSPEAFFDALAAGQSGVRRLPEAFAPRLATRITACVDFDADAYFVPSRQRMLDRVSQFALVAAAQAIADSGWQCSDADRQTTGVFIGTGMGGANTVEDGYATLYRDQLDRVKPFSVLLAMNNAAAAWIGIDQQLRGPNLTYSTACSSSAVAIGEAWRRVRSGEATVMIAGGAEAPLTTGTLKAWEALRTLAAEDRDDASTSCKPFAKNRSGLVLAEGAAILVLEEWEHAVRRGARIRGEIIGYGLHTDGAHITHPSVDGQAETMRLALASAGLAPEQIGYINAHGTATVVNDAIETAAIRSVFGAHADRVPVSSTKSMHGHLLGAAGAVELIATLIALERQTAPPTMHLHRADPECDLDYVPNRARTDLDIAAAMSNSFAFGGTNVSLIATRASR